MPENEQLNQFKDEIFRLVSQNKVPEAIGKLIELYKSPDGTYYDDLLLLSRQYKDLTDRQLSGLVDDDKANLEKNRIAHGLINIITNLQTDPVAARHFGIEVPSQTSRKTSGSSTSKPKIKPWIWLIPLGLIALAILIFLFPSKNSSKDNNTNDQVTTINKEERVTNPQTTDAQNPTTQSEQQNSETQVPESNLPTPITRKKSTHSDPEKAKTIQFNKVITEELLSKEDKHYYNFNAPEDRNVKLIVTNHSEALNPLVSMFNERGNRLFGRSAKKAGEGFEHVFTARKGKPFRFEINSRANASKGKYSLLITYPE